jgi:hypothetical protein
MKHNNELVTVVENAIGVCSDILKNVVHRLTDLSDLILLALHTLDNVSLAQLSADESDPATLTDIGKRSSEKLEHVRELITNLKAKISKTIPES